MIRKFKRPLVYLGLLILQIVLLDFIARFPGFVEQYYSNGLYPYISKGLRFLLGWIPFSFGDVFYTVLIVFLIYSLYKLLKNRFRNILKFLTDALLILNVVYFSFHLLWGLNYYRLPLHRALEIDADYTTEELVSLTEKLVKESNELHEKLQPTDSLPVVFPFALSEIFDKTSQGFDEVGDDFPKLDYSPRSIKNSLYRYPLSVMGFSGYLNPITQESQINSLIPKHRWPLVSCHEQAHQLGFAKENEANFIAVMATTNNPDPYFKYSGYIFALRYCLNEVYRRDPELAKCLNENIRSGIHANYNESYEFWASYANPLEPYLAKFYSNFLKVNNQPAGLKSYSYVVALLVNYFKEQSKLP